MIESPVFPNLVLGGKSVYAAFGILTTFGSELQRFIIISQQIHLLEPGSETVNARIEYLYDYLDPHTEDGFESKMMSWREIYITHQLRHVFQRQ
ncbi:hypothetical protein A3C32_01830 [Candidatus Daviesbacteria bacterium RIFCSPHIGHO2_02_FULL_41_14]|uniref:Uncharacterized protein n=1 Tax=Candidatus Daviesbacteria bacterium RIFCSPLOWO2_01_FULL_40_24 TaxID=1797787 RepID=A0A1F5MJQ6_9BACT|nr:MAG: hypothetical protein A2780_01750 [Candidatus Daviesbacteria bacterium RIFCSPHIGHO2_01_FULL_41_45]OGE35374.1 MAG: hypothetical protein A3C32_01830 [Candidatus Daviesbacteria bacterium RIFCSPHIGHO2_02_FULL_41_14]OGE65617.1 MAG: hypothetical protein A3B49_02930 [Candidatus Daviesbacteria bacterium RIFCSPLOWO2_01_FULL_40_24]